MKTMVEEIAFTLPAGGNPMGPTWAEDPAAYFMGDDLASEYEQLYHRVVRGDGGSVMGSQGKLTAGPSKDPMMVAQIFRELVNEHHAEYPDDQNEQTLSFLAKST